MPPLRRTAPASLALDLPEWTGPERFGIAGGVPPTQQRPAFTLPRSTLAAIEEPFPSSTRAGSPCRTIRPLSSNPSPHIAVQHHPWLFDTERPRPGLFQQSFDVDARGPLAARFNDGQWVGSVERFCGCPMYFKSNAPARIPAEGRLIVGPGSARVLFHAGGEAGRRCPHRNPTSSYDAYKIPCGPGARGDDRSPCPSDSTFGSRHQSGSAGHPIFRRYSALYPFSVLVKILLQRFIYRCVPVSTALAVRPSNVVKKELIRYPVPCSLKHWRYTPRP